jgi:prepilin-type N-terminal cleavage/methylation domain-containing protein
MHWRIDIHDDEGGFTLIELVVALAILLTGIFGLLTGFASSQQLSLISERHAAMAHVAEKEIERLEGIAYASLELTSAPTASTTVGNPGYYVSGANYEWDRNNTSTTEPLVIDATNGTVPPTGTWTEGQLSGTMYDYITWTTDPKCSPGCPASQDYKRLIVGVTINGAPQPEAVYASSSIADPNAAPPQGVQNGNTGNPLQSPITDCKNSSGSIVPCEQGITNSTSPVYFLHDCSITASSCSSPSGNHGTHPTAGPISGLTCATTNLLGSLTALIGLGLTNGCPQPDVMDPTPPTGGSSQPCYQYSTDVSPTGYSCGSAIQPTCAGSGPGCGTTNGGASNPPSTNDCSGGAWANNLINLQTHFWVSSPVQVTTTFTGAGALNMYSQAVGGANALVSFCIELYRIPNEGVAGLPDLLLASLSPVALGGAAYVAATDPSTGGNWPSSPTQTSFAFNFTSNGTTVTLNPGDRLGVRIWVKVNLNVAINLIYDNPVYPAALQLNVQ